MTYEEDSIFNSKLNDLTRKVVSGPMILITLFVIFYMLYRTRSFRGGYAIFYLILIIQLGYWTSILMQAWFNLS